MPTIKIDPPISELNRLRPPLTQGESRVLTFFSNALGQEWEIYIQPHLNGLRPDFVLLNPRVGIAVFEVCGENWDFNALEYLYGSDGNKTFSLNKKCPLTRIQLYKQLIAGLFCPSLPPGHGFGLITAGIIFPFADSATLDKVFRSAQKQVHGDNLKHYPLVGREALNAPHGLKKILPNAYKHRDDSMSPEIANELRRWLIEPEYSREQRTPFKFTPRQAAVINTRTKDRFRRIKGAAGSGKTVVIAARAAKLADEGLHVLLITYNITLINYLRDCAVRCPKVGESRRQLTIWNFHQWARILAITTGHKEEYDALWRKSKHEEDYKESWRKSKSVSEILAELSKKACEWAKSLDEAEKYDAILVDEGQDFCLEWWLTLRGVLAQNGEMLLSADSAQNIYGVSQTWLDAPGGVGGAGFGSQWYELSKTSFRMPNKLCNLAASFLSSFLPESADTIERQSDLFDHSVRLKWWQYDEDSSREVGVTRCMRAISDLLQEPDLEFSVADLTFITDSVSLGKKFVEQLRENKIRCVDTFGTDKQESALKKRRFFKGDARVKATTIHSFKGWEATVLIVHISPFLPQRDLNEQFAQVYTALSRLKAGERGGCLTVVCGEPRLRRYGATWPEFSSE